MENDVIRVGVGVIILKDGKVLLGKHNDGEWRLPGGKMELGEEFEQTAKRKIFEETGLNLNRIKIICANNDKLKNGHWVSIGALSEDFSEEPIGKEPDKVSAWEWFKIENPPFPVFLPSAKILMNYRKGTFYFTG